MKTNLAIAAALATIMTTGVIDTAEAADKKKKEKCLLEEKGLSGARVEEKKKRSKKVTHYIKLIKR